MRADGPAVVTGDATQGEQDGGAGSPPRAPVSPSAKAPRRLSAHPTPPPPPPPPPEDLARLFRYFEWADVLRARVVPDVAVAFRFASTRSLTLPPSAGLLELLSVAEMMRHDNSILSLDCSGMQLGDAGAAVLADLLPQAAHLRELRLEGAGVGEAGAVALFRAAAHAPSPSHLLLAGNPIGPGGAAALARLLRRTRTLSYVDVSACRLQTSGVGEITHALVARAQKRLDRARRRHPNSLPLHLPLPLQLPQPQRARADSNVDDPLSDGSAPPSATLQAGPVSLWGLVFGDVSELVVTNDACVRTVWKNAAVPGGPALSSSSSHGGPAGGASDGTAAAAAAAAASSLSASGATSAPGSLPTLAAAEQAEVDLDIEVKVAGNFVTQERFNAAIHGVGLVAALLGVLPLLRAAQRASSSPGGADAGPLRLLGSAVYLATLVFFFATATLNHALFMVDSYLFRILDHSAAFALIAGTYTPFLLVNLSGSVLGPLLLAAVWLLALVGMAISTAGLCRAHSPLQRRARILLYGLIGWLGLIPYALARECVSSAGWQLLTGGGVAFSLGIFLYMRQRRSAASATSVWTWWYLLVLLSSAAHYAAVLWHVAPPTGECLAGAEARGLSVDGLGGPGGGGWLAWWVFGGGGGGAAGGGGGGGGGGIGGEARAPGGAGAGWDIRGGSDGAGAWEWRGRGKGEGSAGGAPEGGGGRAAPGLSGLREALAAVQHAASAAARSSQRAVREGVKDLLREALELLDERAAAAAEGGADAEVAHSAPPEL